MPLFLPAIFFVAYVWCVEIGENSQVKIAQACPDSVWSWDKS